MGASLASDFAAGGTVRNVAIGLVANGVPVPGAIEFTHESNNFFTCDTWSAQIALDGQNDAFGPAFWSGTRAIEVALSASLTGAGDLAYVTGGMVDKISGSLGQQRVTIHGRDYSAKLIDTLTNDMFVNQTASQIATTMAQRFGLTPQITATTIPAGWFLSSEYGHASQDVSVFRLLSFLAQQEGFDFYLDGKALVFGPPAALAPLVVTFQYADATGQGLAADVPDIEWDWDQTLADQVTVQTRSWSPQTAEATIATWQSQPTAAVPAPNRINNPVPTQTYTRAQTQGGLGINGPFYIDGGPMGLTQQQADQRAQKKLADIRGNERALRITNAPAQLGVTARQGVSLVGTGTALDQTYTIGSLTRTFGWNGAVMSISAKASSPQTAVRL